MNLAIINFTLKGGELNQKISCELEKLGHSTEAFTISKFAKQLGFLEIGESLNKWTEKMFKDKDGIIFIGACGIAVRSIAPFIQNKKVDPAVIVIDEKGRFIIPILAGHIGGANYLSKQIARITGGQEVLTTATDVNGKFAVDVFATEKGLYISDMKAAKDISSRILEDKEIGILSDFKFKNNIPKGLTASSSGEVGIYISLSENKPFDETLNLIPKIITLGIGCRRNTEFEKIESLVMKTLKKHNISIYAVKKIASIDLKAEEQGILEFCKKHNLDFEVYSSEELRALKGDFSESSFVNSITGVSNVCERSAVIASDNGKLMINKTAEHGVTIAAALEDWSVEF